MDLAIDHFLQLLFAMNKVYFPSRKRTLELIGHFEIKPHNCIENLLEIVRLGGYSETLDHSYELWCRMVNDLMDATSGIMEAN
ncbi:MAG TPA: hypothetical protein VN258_13560 [Mobilitalea sp.]|nr:hypothetical protein [Mobilitalea sp.]